MSIVYYEELNINGYNLLIAYTKDEVVQLKFNCISRARHDFIFCLKERYKKIIKNRFSSEYSLVIQEYLLKKSRCIDIPYKLFGNDKEKKLWNCVNKIPYGEIITLSEFNKKYPEETKNLSINSIIQKCNVNIIIPTHRVVFCKKLYVSKGSICDIKMKLITLEGHKIEKKGNIKSKKNLYIIK